MNRHGLSAIKVAVKVRGMAAIDKRTLAAQDLLAWKEELLRDLGGAEAVSAQRMALIDAAVRTKLFLEHVDAFLVSQDSLVNRRRKSLIPVLKERQSLCDGLSRILGQLGLDRIPKPAVGLREYIAAKEESAS